MNQVPVSEADLHAYLDGELPEQRCLEVEAYLAARPAEIKRLLAYRDIGLRLRERFNRVLDEPLPPRLLHAMQPRAMRMRRWMAVAAIAVVGAAAGWTAHAILPSSSYAHETALADLPRRAALAHAIYTPEVKHPVEVGAEQRDHMAAWLSKRLGTHLQVPMLDSLGYTLVGGRLLPGASGPVAQFMYHDAQGKRLTIYISTERGVTDGAYDSSFRSARQGKVGVVYWHDSGFGCAVSGDFPQSELTRVAHLAYDGLEKND